MAGASVARGGKTVHGASIGILMLETRFPRVPGDLGNARTYPFPVLFQVVPGASPDAVVRQGAAGLEEMFIESGRSLVRAGADGILGNCGFLSLFQESLAEAVGVPVVSSPLLQLPLVDRLLPPGRRAGILTISAATLTGAHLEAAGLPPDTPMAGTDGGQEFSPVILEDRAVMDVASAERDVVAAAESLAAAHPEVGAIVLECTNMSPYAAAIRRATGLPVATPYALAAWFQELLSPRCFPGP